MSALLAVLIPFPAWLGCYLLCRELAVRRRIHPDRGLSWVLACVGWGVLLTLIVEGTGALGEFAFPAVTLAWLVAGAGTIGLARRLAGTGGGSRQRLVWAWRETPYDGRLFAIGAFLLIAALGLIAIFTATTNYDSMTYHLARVAHWVERGSVSHYPTADWRQLQFGPWAEFAIANFYLLDGGDRLANSVQWFAALTSILAAALIARQLLPGWEAAAADGGAARPQAALARRAASLTALLVVSIPIGVGQATTTQNDYVIACWLVCAVSLCLALYYEPANPWYTAGFAGALSLGFLTKSTMALLAAPFAGATVLYLLVRLPTYRLRLRLLGICLIVFVAINAGHMSRNFALYGSPIGSDDAMTLLRVPRITVSGTASNVLRNMSLYTATGIEPVSVTLARGIRLLHRLTGRDLNDPDLTFIYTPFFIRSGFVVGDSEADGAYHGLLIVLTLALLMGVRLPRKSFLWIYAGLIAVAFVLLAGLLRWQPWHSRFHLGLYILFMPLAAVVVLTTLPRWLTAAIGVGFVAVGVVCLFTNISRPLTRTFLRTPREQQYFLFNPNAYTPYRSAANAIMKSGCRDVVLLTPFESWEYPFWALLRNRGFHGHLANVGVEGPSATLPEAPRSPCAMMSLVHDAPPALVARFPVQTDYGGVFIRWIPTAALHKP